MKSLFYRIASIGVLLGFVCYWVFVTVLTLPHIPKQKNIAAQFGKPGKWLVFNWRFFARPGTSNQRMYVMATTGNLEQADTLEIIESITHRKQSEAPFNQQANIIDHFIHYHIYNIQHSVITHRSLLKQAYPSMPDSFYATKLASQLQQSKETKPVLAILERYCKNILREQYPAKPFTQFRYVITSESIPAFGSSSSIQSTTIIVDSGYRPY